ANRLMKSLLAVPRREARAPSACPDRPLPDRRAVATLRGMAEPKWVADALVIFGITGDLANRMTFPALYRLQERGALTCPVIGVASSPLTPQQLVRQAFDSIQRTGEPVDEAVFARLARRVTYLPGDATDPQLYKALSVDLSSARRPL